MTTLNQNRSPTIVIHLATAPLVAVYAGHVLTSTGWVRGDLCLHLGASHGAQRVLDEDERCQQQAQVPATGTLHALEMRLSSFAAMSSPSLF